MTSYKERAELIKALSEDQYFKARLNKDESESVRIGDRDGRTGRYQVLRQDGGITNNGIKTFNQAAPQDGFVRVLGNGSGGIALDHRNRKREERRRVASESIAPCPIKILCKFQNDLYISGDRLAEKIYTIPTGYKIFSARIFSFSTSTEDYIIQLVLAKDGLNLSPQVTPYIGSLPNESSFNDFWRLVQFNGTQITEKILPAFQIEVSDPISIYLNDSSISRSFVDYKWFIPIINGYGWWQIRPVFDIYSVFTESVPDSDLYYALDVYNNILIINPDTTYYFTGTRPSNISIPSPYNTPPISQWNYAVERVTTVFPFTPLEFLLARSRNVVRSNVSVPTDSTSDLNSIDASLKILTDLDFKINNSGTIFNNPLTTTTTTARIAIGNSNLSTIPLIKVEFKHLRFSQGSNFASQLIQDTQTTARFYRGNDFITITDPTVNLLPNLINGKIGQNKVAFSSSSLAPNNIPLAFVEVVTIPEEDTTISDIIATQEDKQIALTSIPSDNLDTTDSSYRLLDIGVSVDDI